MSDTLAPPVASGKTKLPKGWNVSVTPAFGRNPLEYTVWKDSRDANEQHVFRTSVKDDILKTIDLIENKPVAETFVPELAANDGGGEFELS